MTVRLLLQASLRRYHPGLPEPLATSAATVGGLLDQLRIPRGEAALLFVNGQRAGPQTALREGDEIRVFPLLGGG